MKLFVIGSQDAVWGFALAGVRGRIVTTAEEMNQALSEALDDEDVGIILVTEDVANLDRRRVEAAMVRSTVPLVVEIPGPEGPSPDRSSLSEIIRRTIGVRI